MSKPINEVLAERIDKSLHAWWGDEDDKRSAVEVIAAHLKLVVEAAEAAEALMPGEGQRENAGRLCAVEAKYQKRTVQLGIDPFERLQSALSKLTEGAPK